MTYRRIIAGTDGSERASLAVRHAAMLAAACEAELVVVSAYPEHQSAANARAAAEAPEEIRWRVNEQNAAEENASRAAEAARRAGAARTHTAVRAGDPAEVLLAVAEEQDADLVVVGNKGMSSPTRFLLGSVPNRVSHHAPCDVLIADTAVGGTP